MKVLVTGASGFIGSRLCKKLVEQGHTVRAFHRPTSSLAALGDTPVEHAIGDLTQPETLAPAMKDIEIVYHTAALMGIDKPGKLYTVTVEGTRAVLDAAREAGVRRFVHTSSMAAMGVPEQGPAGAGHPALITESHTWNYRPEYWPYGYAKYLAELEVERATAMGLDTVIVNPSAVYGAGDLYRQTSAIVVQVAQQHIPGIPEGGLNAVHVDDVVQGHIAAAELGRSGQRYILGAFNLTFQAFIQKIAQIAGVPAPTTLLPSGLLRASAGVVSLLKPFLHLPISPSQFHMAGYFFYCDTRKAQVELRLPQPRSLEEALQDAYDWYVSTGAIKPRR